MAFFIFLSCILTCSLTAYAASSAATFSVDLILSYFSDTISTAVLGTTKGEIEAARAYYFFKLCNNDYSYSGDLFTSDKTRFTDDYLHFAYSYYRQVVSSGVSDEYDKNGNIFMSAGGFPNDDWSLKKIKFNTMMFLPVGHTMGEDFRDYYQTFLARYLLAQGQSATDPNPGKSGLDIAPGYATPEELQTDVYALNNVFSVKNGEYKVSYRTDNRFQAYSGNSSKSFDHCVPLYENYKFFGSDPDDVYIWSFVDLGDKYYFMSRKYHLYFTTEEHWYEDRDEIESISYTLNFDYINLNSSSNKSWDDAAHYTFDVSNYPYAHLNLIDGFDTCSLCLFSSFGAYSSLTTSSSVYKSYSLRSVLPYFLDFYPDVSFNENSIRSTIYKSHFVKVYSEHDKSCSYGGKCDFGYYSASHDLSLTYDDIDFSRIPKDYFIEVNGGDTIYNYNITNPSTGQTSTLNEYITNNYTYVEQGGDSGGGSEGSGSGGSVSGDVNVHGDVGVNGEIDVNVDVNVNQGGTSIKPGDVITGDVDLGTYYEQAVEQTNGLNKFLGEFFSFLPNDILMLLGLTVAVAFICRLLGR